MLDFIRQVFCTNPMKTDDAIHYFGTAAAVARALQISKSAVSQWGELVPLATAARLERITNGALELDLNAYPRKIPSSIEVRSA